MYRMSADRVNRSWRKVAHQRRNKMVSCKEYHTSDSDKLNRSKPKLWHVHQVTTGKVESWSYDVPQQVYLFPVGIGSCPGTTILVPLRSAEFPADSDSFAMSAFLFTTR